MSTKTLRQRERRRKYLRKYKGGKCESCGYNGTALCYHHRDPSNKNFNISTGLTRSMKTLIIEADKCDLLCMNCHHEIEYGRVA